MMTDPIADMLTRIRNALRSGSSHCVVPGSKLKVSILDAMKRIKTLDEPLTCRIGIATGLAASTTGRGRQLG